MNPTFVLSAFAAKAHEGESNNKIKAINIQENLGIRKHPFPITDEIRCLGQNVICV